MNHTTLVARCLSSAAAACALLCAGCAGPHAIAYSIDPLEGAPVVIKTPVLVRTLADLRPPEERFEPKDIALYDFYSSDKTFKEPVDVSVTRMLQLELANAGIEVADEGNHLLGEKPYIRIDGDILDFHVAAKEVPIETIQNKVKTLWRQQQYAVKVGLRIQVIDAKSKRVVMKRVYDSHDSFTLRSEMIDVKAYQEGKDIDKARWTVAGDQYCTQLLNDHLKRVLVKVRQDIVAMLTPEQK